MVNQLSEKKTTIHHSGLSINKVKITKTLFGIALLLTVVSLCTMGIRHYTDDPNLHRFMLHVTAKFNLDTELSVPTFFATCLLLTSSALLWLVMYIEKSTTIKRLKWGILSGIFLLLALDEAAALHDVLNNSSWVQTHISSKSEFLHWGWVLPGLLFVLLIFSFYVPFLLALPRRTAGLFLLAGGIFVGGAVGLEALGATYFIDYRDNHSFSYILFTHLEEFMEMFGLIIFIYSLLDYIGKNAGRMKFIFSDSQEITPSFVERV